MSPRGCTKQTGILVSGKSFKSDAEDEMKRHKSEAHVTVEGARGCTPKSILRT